MTCTPWMRLLGAPAAGLILALGVSPAVAWADDAGSADADSASAESTSSDNEPAETPTAHQDSADDGGQVTGPETPSNIPEADVSASTVTIRADDDADVPANPDGEREAEEARSESVVTERHRSDFRTPEVKQRADVTPERADVVPSESADEVEPAPQTVTSDAAAPVEPADPESFSRTSTSSSTTEEADAVAPTATVSAPPQPTLVNVIGTVIFTVIAHALRLFETTPVVPPGSRVTIGRSTLDLDCGCGQSVDARWYFPNDPEVEPRSVVLLSHGFLRTNSAMSALAVQIAERTNSVVVTPTFSFNPFTTDGCWINGEPMQRAVADLFVGDREALTASARRAGFAGTALPSAFVLSGHSAGGGLAAAAAGFTVGNGAVSDLLLVLMLDGVPTGDSLRLALEALDGDSYRDVFQIAAPPYAWNAYGSGVDQLAAARPGKFVGVQLVGGSHIDAEGASTDILAAIAAGFSKPQNVAAVADLATGWINDALRDPGDEPSGVYGTPGGNLTLTTSAGDAQAVALGVPAVALVS